VSGCIRDAAARERGFDGERNALLGFERRIAGRFGVYLHLDVGDVRHGVIVRRW